MSREIVEEGARRIIIRTPVDSGLLASNWVYGAGAPNRTTSEVPGERILHQLTDMAMHPAGLKHYVTNSVAYAKFVEAGTSKMAPRAMVGLTMVEAGDIVRHAVNYAQSQRP